MLKTLPPEKSTDEISEAFLKEEFNIIFLG